LAAAEKDNLCIQAVLAKKSGLVRYPDMYLVVRDRRIADLDFLKLLSAGQSKPTKR
jgi:hypothetical protein